MALDDFTDEDFARFIPATLMCREGGQFQTFTHDEQVPVIVERHSRSCSSRRREAVAFRLRPRTEACSDSQSGTEAGETSSSS